MMTRADLCLSPYEQLTKAHESIRSLQPSSGTFAAEVTPQVKGGAVWLLGQMEDPAGHLAQPRRRKRRRKRRSRC